MVQEGKQNNPNSPNDDPEDCVPCHLKAGIGLMLDICEIYKYKDVDCKKIKNNWVNGQLDHNEVLNTLLDAARNSPKSWNDFDEVIDIMKKKGVIKDA